MVQTQVAQTFCDYALIFHIFILFSYILEVNVLDEQASQLKNIVMLEGWVFHPWAVTNLLQAGGDDSCLPFRINNGEIKCLCFVIAETVEATAQITDYHDKAGVGVEPSGLRGFPWGLNANARAGYCLVELSVFVSDKQPNEDRR